MKVINKASKPRSVDMHNRFDGVRMTEPQRDIAEAYLRKTDAMLNLIWFARAHLRTAFAGRAHSKDDAQRQVRKPGAVHLS